MTTPIDPGNTGALAKIAENGMAYGMDRGMGGEAIAAYVANGIARAVCPTDCVVVRRDDLETALYGSQYWGEELRQDGEQEALDRLRALIGDGHA